MLLNKRKILHVTEAFGGGVTTAINTYVKHSNSFEHHLVASVRSEDLTGEELNGEFNSVKLVKRNLRGLFECFSFVKKLNPDVIHLHSTYAGFFMRIHPFIDKSKIIYTPHGFAFLRDDNVLFKKVYYYIEHLLASKTKYIAGCGMDETNIARSFGNKVNTHSLVNVCEPMVDKIKFSGSDRLKIGMIGRVTPQKGVDFFASVASHLKNDVEFIWIGGGEQEGVKLLESAGVTVTGWLTRPNVIKHLLNLDYYFHSAAWDGFPISVLEAAEVGLPIMLREIGPFSAENLSCVKDEDAAIDEIALLITLDREANYRLSQNSENIRFTHTSEKLIEALKFIYNN